MLKRFRLFGSGSKNRPAVAFCFFGITRSLRNFTIHSINKNIFEAVHHAGYNYDTFCHIYRSETITNPRSEEMGVPNDWQAYELLKPVAYKIEDMDKQSARLNAKYHLQNGDPWNDRGISMANMLLQWHSIQEVWKLMTDYAVKNDKHYSVIVFLRPDMEFMSSLKLKEKVFDDERIYTPSAAAFEGCNDRFAFGSPRVMEIYADRYRSVETFLASGEMLNSENYLLYHLKAHNITVKDAEMYCRRVRTTGLKMPH
jgi:hypothetical protein